MKRYFIIVCLLISTPVFADLQASFQNSNYKHNSLVNESTIFFSMGIIDNESTNTLLDFSGSNLFEYSEEPIIGKRGEQNG